MRVTLTIEDNALVTARTYARARSIKPGQAVSELIQRGSAGKVPIRQINGVWVFDLPPDSPVVTAERVRQFLENVE